MTTTRRPKDPRQLALPHVHYWCIDTLATPGPGTYAAVCQCGATRTFPTEPVVRSITIKPRREDRQ